MSIFLSFLSVQLIRMLHSVMCLSAIDNASTQPFSVLRIEFIFNILYNVVTFSRLFQCLFRHLCILYNIVLLLTEVVS